MSSAPALAVTGSTGRLGGRVADRLAGRGVAQRLVCRDPSRAPRLAGAEAVAASYGDGDGVRAALAGVEVLLLVSASESPDRVQQHLTAVDAAADAGVRHVVYTSFLGAAPDATFTLARDHWATEQRLREAAGRTGLTWTFLRDSLYADFLPLMAGDDGVLRGPAGEGRAALVATDDVADAAVAVLLDPAAHAGATYDLTGPQALSFAEMAQVLTAAGRPTSYVDETLEQAYASRAGYGAPDWQVDAWVSTYTAVAAGELERVSPDVERLTGRPATSLEELLRRQVP